MVPLSVTLEGPITLGFPLLRDKNNLENRPSIFIKSISLSAFQISLLNRVIQVLVSAILVILLNYLSANFYAEEKKNHEMPYSPVSLKQGLPIQTRLYARPGIHLPLPPSVGNKDVHCCTCLQSSPVSPVISCPFRPQPRVSCLPFLTGHQGGCGAGVLYRLLRWVIRPLLFYAFCADLSCSFHSCRY